MYHIAPGAVILSHVICCYRSRLESHTVQGSKGNETRRRNGKSFDGGGGHRSSRTRSTSRSTGGRSQSQDSSGSGSQRFDMDGHPVSILVTFEHSCRHFVTICNVLGYTQFRGFKG